MLKNSAYAFKSESSPADNQPERMIADFGGYLLKEGQNSPMKGKGMQSRFFDIEETPEIIPGIGEKLTNPRSGSGEKGSSFSSGEEKEGTVSFHPNKTNVPETISEKPGLVPRSSGKAERSDSMMGETIEEGVRPQFIPNPEAVRAVASKEAGFVFADRILDMAGRWIESRQTMEGGLTLTDAAMGEVSIEFKAREKKLTVQMTVESEEAKASLEARLDSFRQRMGKGGYDEVTVNIGLDHRGEGSGERENGRNEGDRRPARPVRTSPLPTFKPVRRTLQRDTATMQLLV